MFDVLDSLTAFIASLTIGLSKGEVRDLCVEKFDLIKDRSIFYCDDFAIRFSGSKSDSFSNTVTSISNIHKYDEKPLISCLVTPTGLNTSLMNSTFIKKVSHSSRDLRTNNLRGSINGSDIMTVYQELENEPNNFHSLFLSHQEFDFQENLERIVEATNNIIASRDKLNVSKEMIECILEAPNRTSTFIDSDEYIALHKDLDDRVRSHEAEIRIASLIPNVKIRGQLIEYLVTGESNQVKSEVVSFLKGDSEQAPYVTLENALGDYKFEFDDYKTETDIKTKVLYLGLNPKAYNVDKLLDFLSEEMTVFLLYFIGIEKNGDIKVFLTSPFETNILKTTAVLHHWAGRNSRGVTQFNGEVIKRVIREKLSKIEESDAREFLKMLIKPD